MSVAGVPGAKQSETARLVLMCLRRPAMCHPVSYLPERSESVRAMAGDGREEAMPAFLRVGRL